MVKIEKYFLNLTAKLAVKFRYSKDPDHTNRLLQPLSLMQLDLTRCNLKEPKRSVMLVSI